MTARPASAGAADDERPKGDALWPPADYHAQLERLRAAVGETVYIAELRDTDTQLGVRISDEAWVQPRRCMFTAQRVPASVSS